MTIDDAAVMQSGERAPAPAGTSVFGNLPNAYTLAATESTTPSTAKLFRRSLVN